MSRIEDEDESTSEGTGSGRSGDMGTPSKDKDHAPPSNGQDENEVVSGGGVADHDDDGHA